MRASLEDAAGLFSPHVKLFLCVDLIMISSSSYDWSRLLGAFWHPTSKRFGFCMKLEELSSVQNGNDRCVVLFRHFLFFFITNTLI